ncbi:MAG: histidine phosphatase family protein [Sphaerochaetaceae bacterium]|nr:histidine phosphatase family protein [uncultured Sphaerochaeta sp.]MDC7228740.1 histidine phosphatase family protein [Sphaerochaetaceae bacterium]
MKTRIYFVRHGETDFNVQHRFQGSTDNPLNGRGLEQASCLWEPMSNIYLDKVYVSPYKRTTQTAEQVLAGRAIPLVYEPRLCEIHCGQWEGLDRNQIETRWPGMIDVWEHRPDELRMPDGESFQQVQDRSIEAFKEILEKEEGKSIAIVTHMLTIQLIMSKLLDIPIREVWNMVRLENTSITTIDFSSDKEFEVVKWGADFHLHEHLKNPYVRIAGFVQKDRAKYDTSFVEGKHPFNL